MRKERSRVESLVVRCTRAMLSQMALEDNRRGWRHLCLVYDPDIDLATIDQHIMDGSGFDVLFSLCDEKKLTVVFAVDAIPEDYGDWFEMVSGIVFRYVRPIDNFR